MGSACRARVREGGEEVDAGTRQRDRNKLSDPSVFSRRTRERAQKGLQYVQPYLLITRV